MPTGFHEDTTEQRLDLLVDGQRVGHIDYDVDGGHATIRHTEVESAFEGHGYAGELVAEAMRRFRDRNLLVIPECSFARHWLAQHPELHEQVEASWRSRLVTNGYGQQH